SSTIPATRPRPAGRGLPDPQPPGDPGRTIDQRHRAPSAVEESHATRALPKEAHGAGLSLVDVARAAPLLPLLQAEAPELLLEVLLGLGGPALVRGQQTRLGRDGPQLVLRLLHRQRLGLAGADRG